MKKYDVVVINKNYEEEIEVQFKRNGRNYLLIAESLWDPYDREDILPDGYYLFIEGDEDGEWLKLSEEASGIDYYTFNEALKVYYKQEEMNQKGA